MHNKGGNVARGWSPWLLLYFFLPQDERTHVIACQLIVLIVGPVTGRERLGAPTPTISCFRKIQVFNVYFVHHFGIFFLYLKVNQAILLLLLLREEWTNCKVAEECKYTKEGQ